MWFVGLFLADGWMVRSGRLASWRQDPAFLRAVRRGSVLVALVGKGSMVALIHGGDPRLSEAVV